MESNFDFLNKNVLTAQYYTRATQAELSYVMGIYPGVLCRSCNCGKHG